jgi:putative membrane protein
VSRFLRAICVLLPLIFAIAGFNARILADFWLENLVVFIALLALALAYRSVPLSNGSWLMIFVFLCAHEYGAMYAYSNAPLGEWAKGWLHTDRNHYDRLVHLLYGLLITWPAIEACRKSGVRRPSLAAVQFILATSAVYEIIEWIVAKIVAGDLADEFVGAQGDFFDSPEDMAAALLGSLAVVLIVGLRRRGPVSTVPGAGPRGSAVKASD